MKGDAVTWACQGCCSHGPANEGGESFAREIAERIADGKNGNKGADANVHSHLAFCTLIPACRCLRLELAVSYSLDWHECAKRIMPSSARQSRVRCGLYIACKNYSLESVFFPFPSCGERARVDELTGTAPCVIGPLSVASCAVPAYWLAPPLSALQFPEVFSFSLWGIT